MMNMTVATLTSGTCSRNSDGKKHGLHEGSEKASEPDVQIREFVYAVNDNRLENQNEMDRRDLPKIFGLRSLLWKRLRS
jgi:hypothetical protein